MELHEYPRPANDTGIGVHWSTGYATAIGMRQIRDFWLPEMKALGIKWVKIYNHDGALDFAELLLAEGIMPVVRIYRPTPNPSRLDVKDVVQIDAFLRVGVRYFEFNNEPDRDAEWKGGRMPANGLNLVVENTIANLEVILERGGMPALPAVSNGSRWDLVGKIVASGRKDLFAGPVWQAIHNYARNRPLDYPYDIGNQEGAAYTYRFYQTLNDESWQENAWRGRSLEEINRLRNDRSNPGATIMDDAACWLAYEYFDALNQKHLGHSIPILATECGYLVGEDVDPRYPATTPDLHMAQTLEAARVMMGTSQRFAPAPDYYFCTAFWLLANAQLGSTSSWWETHAWYSNRWPGGTLPIVLALKAEPKIARHWQGAVATELVTLHGTVAHVGDNRSVLLFKDETEVAQTTLDSHSQYVFADLRPGAYVVQISGTAVNQPVQLTTEQQELVLDFDLSPTKPPVSKSRIEGTVRGGAGAVLMLVRRGDGEEWVTMAKDDGSFRFVDLSAGEYSLRVDPQGSRVEQIVLDGINMRTVELAVAGWGHTIRAVSPIVQKEAKLNSVYVAVDGHRGLPVRVHAGEWSSEPVYTGTAPEVGNYGCELTGLEAGHYIVAVDGVPDFEGRYTQLEARLQVDKKATPFVEFVHTEMTTTPAMAASRIEGRVIGGGFTADRTRSSGRSDRGPSQVTSQAVTAILIDSMGRRSEVPVAPDGGFVFANLPAGLYTVALLGYEDTTMVSDLALDGNNVTTVELRMPLQQSEEAVSQGPAHSVIHGIVPDAVGKAVRLVDMVGNEYQQYVDADQRFHFAGLPAGTYSLFVESGFTQSDLIVDGHSGLEVLFSELLTSWDAEISSAGSMPGYSLVRVEVEGMHDLPVHIWKDDWEGMVRRTGSKPDYGPFVLEFSPLGPGRYTVEPEGLGLWAEVDLTGLEAMWVHFRRKRAPLGQNRVVPLARPTRSIIADTVDVAPAGRPDQANTPPITPPVTAVTTNDAAATDLSFPKSRPTEFVPAQPVPTQPAPTEQSGAPADTIHTELPQPTSPPESRQSEHYLFLYAPPRDLDDLAALLRYVACERPQIGRDRWAAFDATRVTIVGGSEDALDVREFQQALESADVEVQLLTENFAALLVQ